MPDDILKTIWPEWQLVKRLGRGSYGVVYEAVRREYNLESRAAIKVISVPRDEAELDSLRSDGLTDEQSRTYLRRIVDDFVREIEMMKQLQGVQNVVFIEDYKVVEREESIRWDIFVRMELLTPLSAYAAGRPGGVLSQDEVIRLGIDICKALEACEKLSIIHRDIKPENILVNETFGLFKLGDFGVARRLQNLTTGLSIKGTPNYMAPEVYNGQPYDERADLYSLGLVLHRLMNRNSIPFTEPTLKKHLSDERTNALRRRMNGEALPAPIDATPAFSEVILRAGAFDPDRRFATAREMRLALERVLNGTYVPEKEEEPPVDDDEGTLPVNPPINGAEENSTLPADADDDGGTVVVNERDEPADDGSGEEDAGGSKPKKLIALALALALVAGLIVGIIWRVRDRKDDPATADATAEPTAYAVAAATAAPTGTPAVSPTPTPTFSPTATPTAAKATSGPAMAQTGAPTASPETTPTPSPKSTSGPAMMRTEAPTASPKPTPSPVPAATTAPSATWRPKYETLSQGSSGDEVVALQKRLNELRYDCGGSDGVYGKKTAEAVSAFQKDAGLTANGVADQQTQSCLYSNTAPENGAPAKNTWEYALNGTGCTITRYNGHLAEVVIPETIDGKKVTAIGDDAFQYCAGLKTVAIPDSVTSIGRFAFYYCTGLMSVAIPDSVTSIGDFAFNYCTGLTSVRIPNSVTTIGLGAFSSCTGLSALSIPDGLTRISQSAFSHCTGVTSIKIPNSVTSIGHFAFSGCTGLTSVTIPNSVTTIASYAFSECSGLSLINIPDSVTSIGEHAFRECTKMTFITIPNSVTTIEKSLLSHCSGLLFVTIPDSVTSIGNHAFYKCARLTSVTIPDGVTSIGVASFASCSDMTSVTIPDSVTTIDQEAFESCESLTDVYYAGSQSDWQKIALVSKGNESLTRATIHYNAN